MVCECDVWIVQPFYTSVHLAHLCFKLMPPFDSFLFINTVTFMLQSFHKEKSLPFSHNTTYDPPLPPAAVRMHRRISSMTFQIQPPIMLDTTAWVMGVRHLQISIFNGESASTSIRNW
ncbi:unnamed protein product [Lactuca saligna]|uniref:Uncharacterized protein n=1 Tax=Lactuca saligna TaxID=75948 RepID=A0AA36EHU8_LACSI|nr:unnamed protein product [Lactuca saligna]